MCAQFSRVSAARRPHASHSIHSALIDRDTPECQVLAIGWRNLPVGQAGACDPSGDYVPSRRVGQAARPPNAGGSNRARSRANRAGKSPMRGSRCSCSEYIPPCCSPRRIGGLRRILRRIGSLRRTGPRRSRGSRGTSGHTARRAVMKRCFPGRRRRIWTGRRRTTLPHRE
jgi:hypothetical protein